MLLSQIDLRPLLKSTQVTASVPCRIDCGGTLDIAAIAIQLERFSPQTATIAISPRVLASLGGGQRDTICVESSVLGIEHCSLETIPLEGPFKLINAIIHHFGVTGIKLSIHSDLPLGSGLGTSGSVAVAVVAVVATALAKLNDRNRPNRDWIARTARDLENCSRSSLTGFQDQLAAAYGGVNVWRWRYSHHSRPYVRLSGITQQVGLSLGKRIAAAFTGVHRASSTVSNQYVIDFLSGRTRREWIRICDLVNSFAKSLIDEDWSLVAAILREEMAIRNEICPGLWPESSLPLSEAAQRHGCVVRTAGGNRAGGVWAFGEPDAIKRLRQEWADLDLNIALDQRGLMIRMQQDLQF